MGIYKNNIAERSIMEQTAFDKIIEKVFDGFKRITPALVAIALCTGAILFLPSSILEKMNLHSLSPIYISILGVIFLFACTLIITICLASIWQWCKIKIQTICVKKKYVRELKMLTKRQKLILGEILYAQSRSAVFCTTDGDILFLYNKGMIYAPSQSAETMMVALNQRTFVPADWLMQIWQQNPEIIPPPEKKTKQKQKLKY
ncbi:MAG: superinfection exclusion B family protein, partial [Bacteroidaceae bacterium]|nr:superinfection exclusion B family protein [Bacteroidaceae bacterium]